MRSLVQFLLCAAVFLFGVSCTQTRLLSGGQLGEYIFPQHVGEMTQRKQRAYSKVNPSARVEGIQPDGTVWYCSDSRANWKTREEAVFKELSELVIAETCGPFRMYNNLQTVEIVKQGEVRFDPRVTTLYSDDGTPMREFWTCVETRIISVTCMEVSTHNQEGENHGLVLYSQEAASASAVCLTDGVNERLHFGACVSS